MDRHSDTVCFGHHIGIDKRVNICLVLFLQARYQLVGETIQKSTSEAQGKYQLSPLKEDRLPPVQLSSMHNTRHVGHFNRDNCTHMLFNFALHPAYL